MDGRYGIGVVLSAVVLAVLVLALRAPIDDSVGIAPQAAEVNGLPPDSMAVAGATEIPNVPAAADVTVSSLQDAATSIESSIFRDGTVHTGGFYDLADGGDYHAAVEQLRANADTAAAHRYAEVRTALEQHDGVRLGAFTINNMGCGRNICLIAIGGPSVGDLQEFTAALNSLDAMGGSSAIGRIIPVATGGELRILTFRTAQAISFDPPDGR